MYNISIVGGGISGLTTAFLLQSLGFKTQIISEFFLTDSFTTRPPFFGSLSPAASIIPHSLYGPHILPSFIDSQEVFRTLLDKDQSGIKVHTHYEIFEDNRDPYDYCEYMDHFEPIDNSWSAVPKLDTSTEISGWRYNCLFADWNIYPHFLMNKYLSMNGKVVRKKLTAEDMRNLDADYIFNCSGLGSVELFNDTENEVYLGHTIILDGVDEKILNGRDISYNFEPGKNLYVTQNNMVQDVYAYSRSGQILLGGSRLAGRILNGKYSGDLPITPILTDNDISMSAHIYNLNKDIIRSFYGIDLDGFVNKEFRKGYRYIRNKLDGLRIEREQINDSPVYHNYGNGGGGVTVSWGASLRQVNMFLEDLDKDQLDIQQLIKLLVF